MSAKWQRSKCWDDEHIPGWAWPARFVLRAFSSIPLAVVLLSFVGLYAVAASVPVGLLALAPTWGLYGLTVLASIGLIAVTPTWVFLRLGRRLPPGARFVAAVLLLIALTAAAVALWSRAVWPSLHYDPATGRGVRLFAEFCERYRSTTVRRLPMLEMSELEFYSWWPLRVVLLAFVANMITATVRRIEFTFVNLGVLTVHTGIVVIALGSVYYKGLKLEGDTLLLAGEPAADGTPGPGTPEEIFYDNTDVALWVQQHPRGMWEQRPLAGVPRYNDYGLDAAGPTALDAVGRRFAPTDEGFTRQLALGVPASRAPRSGEAPQVDGDIAFRILGYASYADPVEDWVRADPGPGRSPTPARFLDFLARFPDQSRSAFRFFFIPDRPDHRWQSNDALAIEWTRAMPDQRWGALTSEFPAGASHAILVEVPGAEGREAFRAIYPATPGADPIDVGPTGYRLQVTELAPQPPFRIITPGYEGSTSSIAIVRVTPPTGPAFDRWAYHRFPEISQDMVEADPGEAGGRARRRPADPGIRIDYLDASIVQIYIDERPDGSVRACVRAPDGTRRIVDRIEPGGTLEEFLARRDPATDPKVDLVLGERWEHAEPIKRPRVVPEHERVSSEVGTHSRAMLAVEVSLRGGSWRRVVWLPHNRYVHRPVGGDTVPVLLPDGRSVELAFGRLAHQLPGFMIQLVDFQAIKYEHRGAPRDYQSIVRVVPTAGRFTAYEHITKLNAPLQAPFLWSDSRNGFANTLGLLRSRFNPGQFKFSQSGWDQEGWDRTQALTDQGQLRRPFARFTILGVGNNPGIHVVAFGGILMSVGIPWAFYVKPWILRRRKAKLQAEHAARPAAVRSSPQPVGASP